MSEKKYWNEEIETLSRPELEKLQLERLKEMVKFSYENAPYYKRSFDEAGVKPEDIKSLDDIAKFPFINKQTERETQGVGSWGGNYVSENVGPMNLLNIKSIAKRRENMLWFRVPQKVYFKYGCLCTALGDLAGKKRAFIVTDKFLYNMGVLGPMLQKLTDMGIATHVFAV